MIKGCMSAVYLPLLVRTILSIRQSHRIWQNDLQVVIWTSCVIIYLDRRKRLVRSIRVVEEASRLIRTSVVQCGALQRSVTKPSGSPELSTVL
ncbi:uncharacterized protein B0T23DRAFT_187323 [Neurospora hispaniola]|uniref:Uncharacterized protein n=1 Tax=Neurospora hispaniola TaxID=588809 RepID=A0AAJ0I349_9PEZI|nr:hypothetical protein B0T23DRAFT_187323 [Neurospora hispaniola]